MGDDPLLEACQRAVIRPRLERAIADKPLAGQVGADVVFQLPERQIAQVLDQQGAHQPRHGMRGVVPWPGAVLIRGTGLFQRRTVQVLAQLDQVVAAGERQGEDLGAEGRQQPAPEGQNDSGKKVGYDDHRVAFWLRTTWLCQTYHRTQRGHSKLRHYRLFAFCNTLYAEMVTAIEQTAATHPDIMRVSTAELAWRDGPSWPSRSATSRTWMIRPSRLCSSCPCTTPASISR